MPMELKKFFFEIMSPGVILSQRYNGSKSENFKLSFTFYSCNLYVDDLSNNLKINTRNEMVNECNTR